MYSVSIHPFGNQLAIGVREGVRIFYILEDEVKIAVELPGKMCQMIQYTNGGHYIAASCGSQLMLIDPYTFKIMMDFNHTHPGNIKLLKWTFSDSYLISVCMNSSVFGKSLQNLLAQNENIYDPDLKKVEEIEQVLKPLAILAVDYDEEYDLLTYAASDGKIYVVTGKDNGGNFRETLEVKGCKVTALHISK